MKTLKELAAIGVKAAALLNKGCGTVAVTRNHPGWQHDEEQRQAFAQAVRDAVLADLVAKPDSSPTPRTDAEEHEGLIRGCSTPTKVIRADFARTLEREIAELNERLIDRQQTVMALGVNLQAASRLLTRCRKLEIRLNRQKEALEAADECLALIEDVGHGAMSDNVTVARGIVLAALSRNVKNQAPNKGASNQPTAS